MGRPSTTVVSTTICEDYHYELVNKQRPQFVLLLQNLKNNIIMTSKGTDLDIAIFDEDLCGLTENVPEQDSYVKTHRRTGSNSNESLVSNETFSIETVDRNPKLSSTVAAKNQLNYSKKRINGSVEELDIFEDDEPIFKSFDQTGKAIECPNYGKLPEVHKTYNYNSSEGGMRNGVLSRPLPNSNGCSAQRASNQASLGGSNDMVIEIC